MALKILLVRVDLAGISCVLGMTEEMVLACLRRAAFKAQEIKHTHLLRELPVTQMLLDEMWNFVARKPPMRRMRAARRFPTTRGQRGSGWFRS